MNCIEIDRIIEFQKLNYNMIIIFGYKKNIPFDHVEAS